MEKEKAKLSGFKPELFLVNKTGDEGKNNLFLRPTSEILFSHYFKKVLQSYSQLPILLNQWCNVYRAEKNTKAFIRSCEFYWQEVHTLHETQEEAMEYLNELNESYIFLAKAFLNLAFLKGEKTVNERFQGAEKTLSLEAIMPDGQAIQIATSHYLGKNFSETFDVKFTSANNILENPYQLSAGCSTRLIGALIMSHSDDQGLVLPFDVAQEQIRIIVLESASDLYGGIYGIICDTLDKYRIQWDVDSNKSFGARVRVSEEEGIPFIAILGKEELVSKSLTIKSRLSKNKEIVEISKLGEYFEKAVEDYSNSLYDRSKTRLENSVVDLTKGASLELVKKEVLENRKIVLVPWFNDEENEVAFKNEKFGFGARCIKENIDLDLDKKCFYSGKKANVYAYFGRSY
ncbi:proline--tRNA ligase [Candidatus Mycoplasma haematohominis]|uniref:proline--tRNA ligase n=1 Tax=Candidatus Mycoplasma haematohominis TaxID=1494318 RepID=A0A478FRY5_9MOLU|nr:proline--tRNA ligase [Candidatus Mycoplasma haemohominis]